MTETLLAEWRPRLKLYATPEGLRAQCVTTEDEGYITLPPGEKGPRGARGPDSRPWWYVDAVETEAELPTGWGLADRKNAVAITGENKTGFWTGTHWIVIPNSLSRQGDPGPALRVLKGTVTTGPVDTDVVVSLEPVDEGVLLHMTIPEGPQGDEGDPGPANRITGSADLANITPQDRAVLRRRDTLWVPEVLPPFARWHTISYSSFLQEPSSSDEQVVATVTLPAVAQDTMITPTGQLVVRQLSRTTVTRWFIFKSSSTFLPDVHCTISVEFDGQIYTIGSGRRPHKSGVYPIVLGPGVTDEVVIPAGQEATLTVTVHRQAGTSAAFTVEDGWLTIPRFTVSP